VSGGKKNGTGIVSSVRIPRNGTPDAAPLSREKRFSGKVKK